MKQKILSFCLISCFLFTSLNAQERNERDKSPEILERVNFKTNNTKADNVQNATPGCNTNTTICVAGVAGPFPFEVSPKEFVNPTAGGGCQVGDVGGENRYGYILLNIETSGSLNLLIDGDANFGFIDAVIYNIPDGISPCVAITNPANQIGCNYASASSGCAQFGTSFSCASSNPAPTVTAGTQIMVIVHGFSNASSTFTLQLGPGAQTGAPNSTIDPIAPICSNAAPVQLTAVTNGGTWSGPGVSASGMFNPAIAGVGTHTINYTIGVAPCTSSSTQTFQVIQAPVANASSNEGSICLGENLELYGTPVANATYEWSGPGGWNSNLLNPTRLAQDASINGTYIFTVTLPNQCQASSNITVNINDTINPTVITQNFTAQLDATGNATIAVSDIDNGSSDNCGIDNLVLDTTSFNCTNVGPNGVTLTVTDSSGNISTGTAIVTVQDTINPTVITQNFTVQLDATGNATIAVSDINNGSSDNCSIDTLVLDVTSFNCTNLGPNTVTLTATDFSGNSSTGTAIVTVQDAINPTVITQNITVNLDASGTATITASQIDNGSSDNCAIDTLVLDITSFNCTNLGPYTVTLTATDFSGNSSTGTAIVTVQDAINPTVITQNITVNLDASGTATITASQIDNGSSDNCAIDTLVLDITSFNCTNLGPNTVTLTATDFSGNISTGTAIVTVQDAVNPNVITQNITVNLDASGTATITASQIDNGSSDNCAIDTLVLDTTSFNCTNLGPNTVTLTATDFSGNSSTGTAIVTVQDAINPTVITQNITVNLDASGTATITASQIDNGFSDNCTIDTLVLDTTSFNCTNLGPNTVTLTATDFSGNSSTGTAIVTVQDAINPTVITQNITVNLDASGTATITASQIDNGSSDNCAIDTLVLDITSFNCTNLGPNTVTLTATDFSGNSSTGTAIVTVQDAINPTVITQNITVNLDASGTATITASQIDNGSSDNCAIDTLVLDITSFNCTNLGPNTVTLTATDFSGNSSTGTAIVTVQDAVNPNVITQNITVNLDASGTATITASQIDNGSSDNCAIDTLVLDITSFNCTNLGPNTVTLTATDFSGNSSTGTAIVTVQDAVNPNVITQNITVNLDASGTATITASQIDNGSSDNCAIDTLVLDTTSFNCTNLGPNTVTLTATDFSGNSSTGTAIVTVQDAINPTVITQNITVNLDASGTATITASQIDNGSSDNCTIDTLVLDTTSFNCTNLGPNTVTLTATDFSGNISTGTATVTVLNNFPPTIITQNITIPLNSSGTASIVTTDIVVNSESNCGVQSVVLDITDFDCTNIGANTVTVTMTDNNGNISTGTAIVTVEDSVNPTVITQDITVNLDTSGTATITASQIDNGSSDNCAIDTLVLDVTSFNCTNLGTNTVTLTATDSSGNSSTGTATVTVEDAVNPTVITQNFTVQLDATGNATIAVSDINNGSFDNCGIDTLVLDVTSFNCINLGANTVTLTATDSSGNSSTGTATVTVEDAVNPTVITQNFTVQLDATGNATIAVSDINNGSFDNCGIDTLVLDVISFNCINLGANTVTLTATDSSGNSSTGTAIVTVQDAVNPTVITQNFTVNLDASGTATITASQIDNGSSDNCGIQTFTLDITSFNCTNVGPNTVTLTATDSSGNSSTGTAIVTVQDTTNPTVITQNFTVQLDATGNATITVSDINNGSSDNCGIQTLVLDTNSFNCTNIGPNTVTLTATDFGGNTSTGTAIVTVQDAVNPTVITQNITVNLDASGTATITASQIDNGSSDNCAIDTLVLDTTSFNCTNVGPNTVTLTATDFSGNGSTGTATVKVVNNFPPTIITQNITIPLNSTGTASIVTTDIVVNSGSNCGVQSIVLDITDFDCTNIGANTVTVTMTDNNGNISTGTAIVTVLPIPEPTVTSLTQEFCANEEPIVADIAVESGLVQWFANATGGSPLSNTVVLSSGTYYVATQYGNCYSGRVAVNVVVKDPPPAPTGNALQYICREQEFTIASLMTNEEEILWYDSPSGGTPLSSSTVLEHQQKYYASQIIGDCESTNRLEVEVEIRYCDVVVYNSVSANGDGKNDYFKIEGMSYFPDNSVEIFNQWGQIVYKTSRYGEANGNYFKGIANTGIGISGNGQTLLPFGTYYYVIQFLNHDKQRMQKTGYLHLNH